MLKVMFAVLLLFLAGCQTVGGVRNECAAAAKSFIGQVNCIESYVAANDYMRDDSFIQEYIMAGRVLADKVAAGEITENEARLAFTREYNEMEMRQQQRNVYNALEYRALRAYQPVCRQVDNHVYCDLFY